MNKPVPDGYRSITPYLVVPDAVRQVEFLRQAFDGVETCRHTQPDGQIAHLEMRIGDSLVMLGQSSGEWKPTGCAIYLYVADVDSVYRRALAAGAASQREPGDQPYGDRNCGVTDPSGNTWWIATRIEQASPEDLARPAAMPAKS